MNSKGAVRLGGGIVWRRYDSARELDDAFGEEKSLTSVGVVESAGEMERGITTREMGGGWVLRAGRGFEKLGRGGSEGLSEEGRRG